MTGALLFIAIGVLAALGFGLMAVSQKQYRRFAPSFAAGRSPTTLRLVGALSIAAAVVPAVARDGVVFGLLVWTTMLTVAAFAVVIGLTRLRGRADAGDADQTD